MPHRTSLSFLKSLPKCEHHIHIEGSLSPALLFTLAERNGISLPSASDDPAYTSIEALQERYDRFSSLDDFLAYYDRASRVLVTRSDFEELAYAYMVQAWRDGVAHAEPSFDLQTHTERGISPDDVILGLHAGLARGQAEFDISYSFILCILRHHSVDSCVEHVSLVGPHFASGVVHGLGMCSTEKNQPPGKFKAAFDKARELGVVNLTAHAGEEGPAAYVREAVEELGVGRIDHGVRCLEDESVVELLRESQTLLTVCPVSNVCLKVNEHLGQVPLRQFIDKGVKFSINSDDPAYFGGHILSVYEKVAAEFRFTPAEWRDIVANGITHSWMPDERKAVLLARLDEVVAETEAA